MATAAANSEAPAKEFKNKGLMDVAKMDGLKQLGFRVENLGSGFSAYEIHGDRRFGPCDSLGELEKLVKDEIGNKLDLPTGGEAEEAGEAEETGDKELTENKDGQQYIPGTGPIVNAELHKAALDHYQKKTTRMEWTEKEKEAKDTLVFLCEKHADLFKLDEDTGKKTYTAGDIVVELDTKETVKVKTRLATDEDE